MIPREPNHHFSGKHTWPAVKGWPMEIISTDIQEHNLGGQTDRQTDRYFIDRCLGGQPCKFFAGNAQKAKSKKAAINISYV